MNVKNTQWIRLMQGAIVAVIGAVCVVAQQSDAGNGSTGTASSKFSIKNWPSEGVRPTMMAMMLKDRTDTNKVESIIRDAVEKNLEKCDSAEEVETMMGHLVATVAVCIESNTNADEDFAATCMRALVDACQKAGEAAADLQEAAPDSADRADIIGRIYGIVAAVFATLGGEEERLYLAGDFVKAIPEAAVAPAVAAINNPEGYVGTAQRAALVETIREVEKIIRGRDHNRGIGILDKFNPEQPITSTTTTTTTTRPYIQGMIESLRDRGVPPPWPPPTRPSPTPTDIGL